MYLLCISMQYFNISLGKFILYVYDNFCFDLIVARRPTTYRLGEQHCNYNYKEEKWRPKNLHRFQTVEQSVEKRNIYQLLVLNDMLPEFKKAKVFSTYIRPQSRLLACIAG